MSRTRVAGAFIVRLRCRLSLSAGQSTRELVYYNEAGDTARHLMVIRFYVLYAAILRMPSNSLDSFVPYRSDFSSSS